MSQHFLLSAQARTLSLKAIYQAGDDEAYESSANCAGPRPMDHLSAHGVSVRRPIICRHAASSGARPVIISSA